MKDKIKCAIDKYGSHFWYKNGNLHRDDDLPAAVWFNGMRAWYQNSMLHRNNGLPAVEYSNGSRGWYWNGIHVRTEPACPVRAEAIKMRVTMEKSDE